MVLGLAHRRLEGHLVVAHGPAVALERTGRAQRGGRVGTQPLGHPPRPVERLRERLAHVGHERVVDELRDIELEVEPAPVGVGVVAEDALDLPVAVGFGISTPEQVVDVWRYADAAVVGSAIVAEIEEAGASGNAPQAVEKFVERLLPQVAKTGGEN